MVQSAERHIKLCLENDFYDIIVSLKASDVNLMMESYRLFSSKFDYPLHLGVTEAGPLKSGSIKSAVGIGSLLAEGIGDTIRVSLTDDSVEEVYCTKYFCSGRALAARREGRKTSKITVLRGRRRERREKVHNLRNLVKSERNFSIKYNKIQ